MGLAAIVEHCHAPSSTQKSRQLVVVELDLRMQDDEAIVFGQALVVDGRDDLDARLTQYLLGVAEEFARALPARCRRFSSSLPRRGCAQE